MYICEITYKPGKSFRVGVENGAPVLLDYTDEELEEQEALCALGLREELDTPFLYLLDLLERPEAIIQQALGCNQVGLLKLALEAGGDKCEFVLNGSALHGAANSGFAEGVEIIKSFMPDPQGALNTALSIAATLNNVGMITNLLSLGADPNGSKKKGSSLSGAVVFGGRETLRALLDAGADPNLNNAYALRYAANSGNLTTIRTILESDIVNKKYVEEIGDIMAEQGRPEIVKVFTDYQKGVRWYEGV